MAGVADATGSPHLCYQQPHDQLGWACLAVARACRPPPTRARPTAQPTGSHAEAGANPALIRANPRAAGCCDALVHCCTLISGSHSSILCYLMRLYLFGKTLAQFNAAILPETSRFWLASGLWVYATDARLCEPAPSRPPARLSPH